MWPDDSVDIATTGLVATQLGDEVVIEDFLEGEEASLFAFVDGEHVYPLQSA